VPKVLPFWGDQPWFLDKLPPELDKGLAFFGFPRERRELQTPALKRLLSAEACQHLVRSPWGRSVIVGLYQTFIPYVLPVLQLGLDLAIAQPWDDERLVNRLLVQEEHRGAVIELAAWAALAQAGEPFSFEREPNGRGESKPDFLVRAGDESWFVEVKASSTSTPEVRASELEWALMPCVADLQADGKTVTVRGTEAIASVLSDEDRHGELPAVCERAVVALETCAKGLRDSAFVAGDYPAADLLIVHVEDAVDAFVEFALWDGQTPQKQATRLIRLVRDAALQVPEGSRAVVLLDVGGFTQLDVLASEFNRTLGQDADVGRYAPIRALIVFAHERDADDRTVRTPFQARLLGRELSPVEVDLCRRLSPQSTALLG
jgi:hypothetical protein